MFGQSRKKPLKMRHCSRLNSGPCPIRDGKICNNAVKFFLCVPEKILLTDASTPFIDELPQILRGIGDASGLYIYGIDKISPRPQGL